MQESLRGATCSTDRVTSVLEPAHRDRFVSGKRRVRTARWAYFSAVFEEFVRGTYPFGRAVRFSIMTTEKTVHRRLFVSMIVSLDGYIEGPRRELDWFEDRDPQFEQYCDEMIDSVGLALLWTPLVRADAGLLAERRARSALREPTSRSRAR